MILKNEILKLGILSDISINENKINNFVSEFNEIINYFDILNEIEIIEENEEYNYNVFREDNIESSISQYDALINTNHEKGYIKAPWVKL